MVSPLIAVDMQIQPAGPARADGIHAVLVASCRDAYEDVLADHTLIEEVDTPSRREAIRPRLATTDAERQYLVALVDDHVVGFAGLQWGSLVPDHIRTDAYLRSLYVLPAHQSEGIGSELLDRAIEAVPETVDRLALSVISRNEAGIRFYESHGFEYVDDGTYEIGGTVYETDIYRTDLDG
jgi:ribosomal protein S18 acetylase RimI-like enzyme